MSKDFPKIKCPGCGKIFIQRNKKKEFCQRRCFKKVYYHRKKAQELVANKHAIFNCPRCDNKIMLEFDPVKKPYLWLHFVCPGCNTLMINVTEFITTADGLKEKIL